MSPRDDLRLEDLLATQATEGLDHAETVEVYALLAERPDVDPEGLELAAAALHAALMVEDIEPLPSGVARRLRRQVRERAPRWPRSGGR